MQSFISGRIFLLMRGDVTNNGTTPHGFRNPQFNGEIMKKEIGEFMKARRFAVVGVSRNPRKFGNTIYRELKNRGYKVYGVNPSLSEIDGDKCYPDLSALKGKVDAAVVCITPDRVESTLRNAAEAEVHHVWLQQGAENANAVKTGESLGIKTVAGKCILMYAEPVRSFHALHRFFARMTGNY